MKIGFIDYFIDEWHANNYPKWIDEQSGSRSSVGLAWAACDKPGGRTTAQWCADFGVRQAASMEAVIADSDGICILSPDNPEQHPALCALPLTSGKPVYVDKTFATDTATARELFALAAAHDTPLCSMSSLRYADEILGRDAAFSAPSQIAALEVRGPGELPNYGVHQLEIVAAIMGTGARRVRWSDHTLTIDYDGRLATITLGQEDFALTATNTAGQRWDAPVLHNYFPNFISAVLRFYEDRIPAVPAAETVEIMAMIEAGKEAQKKPGEWVALPL